MTKHTILCVDDEIDNVEALERIFRRKYLVLKATSGPEALEILDKHRGPVSVIITDQRMPEMTGVQFLEKTLEKYPDTLRLLLTGYTDLESVIEAVNRGQIFRYLTKPWDPVDLANTVDQAVDRYQIGKDLQVKNRELQEALAELKSLDAAKSNFMILVNHELKTPLTSIINFSSLLQETTLDDEQKLYLDRVMKSTDRLKSLVDDVLIIIKSENGKLIPSLKEEVIKSVQQFMNGPSIELMKSKNILIKEQLAVVAVHCDPMMIGQAFTRILHNALKFGNSDSSIIVSSEQTANGKIVFKIINQGPPINENVMDKITHPFFIDENIMNHSAGTGLGLTVSNVLLKAHQSGVQIRNLSDGVEISFNLNPA